MPDAPRPHATTSLIGALAGLLLLLALRPVLGDATGRFLGAATDAVHHAWGLWWFARGEGEGAITRLVSFPTGERGALLSPLTAAGALPWGWLFGPALAYNLACAATLIGAALGVGLLGAALGRDLRVGALAALALLVGRPLALQLGLGVPEGVAIGLPCAALAGMRWWAAAPRGPALSCALGLGAALAVIENPYALVPLAPAAGISAAILLIRHRRAALPSALAALLAGLLLVLARLLLAGGELGGNETTAVRFLWAGRVWWALEGEGGLNPLQLIHPLPLVDLGASAAEIRLEGGGVWLGALVLALALCGALLGGGWGAVALFAALGFALLAAGSLPAGQRGAPGPFFFVNLAISQVLPPLTQPLRFLSFAGAALAVGAALGVQGLARRRAEADGAFRAAALGLALEAALLGGPSLAVPTTDLRPLACLAGLGRVDAGAVHVVAPAAWDRERANTAALRLQLLHGLPGTQRGIGGWRQEARDPSFDQALRELEGALRGGPRGGLGAARARLAARGLGWVLVAEEAAPGWLGPAERACGGWAAWRLR